MRFQLVELLSESDYPNGTRIEIAVTPEKGDLSTDTIAKISRAVCNVSLPMDVIVDNSDGTYQICVPSNEDWLKEIGDKVRQAIGNNYIVQVR